MDELEKLKLLPTVQEALKGDRNKIDEYARGIIKATDSCFYIIANEKLEDWCSYLGCKDGVCDYFSRRLKTTGSSVLVTLPFPEMCFDAWFCPPDWSASYVYRTQVVFALLMISAFILTLIYLPSFIGCHTKPGNRSTRILFTTMVLSDLLNICVYSYLYCVAQLNSTHTKQLAIYSEYVARAVPVLYPLHEFCNTLSLWLIIALLLEQYLYLTQGKHAAVLITTKGTIKLVGMLLGILISFTVMKTLARLTLFKFYDKKYRVYRSNLGKDDFYDNLITNWIKVPLEYFAPLLILGILLIGIYTKLGEQSIIRSNNNKLNEKLLNAHNAAVTTPKDHKHRVNIKNFIILNRNNQEERLLIGITFLSTFAMLFKIPQFIHHILTNEKANISRDNMFLLDFISTDLQAILLFIKPIVYITFSLGYCGNIKRFLSGGICCVANEDNDEDNCEVNNDQLTNFSLTNKHRIDSLKPVVVGRTFEQTIANQMRQSISYRNSVVVYNCKNDEIESSNNHENISNTNGDKDKDDIIGDKSESMV